MNSITSNLLWTLIGSIATIIITKSIELFQQERERRFLLRKLYFEKKLVAAETAFSNFQKNFSLIHSLSSLYEMFSADKNDFNVQVFTQMNDEISKRLTAVGDAAQESLNAYTLFFDLGNQDNQDNQDRQTYHKFYQCLSEIRNFDIPMEVALKLYDEKKGEPMADFFWEEAEKVARQIKNKFAEMAGILQEMNREAERQMVIIKAEMKKYA